MRKIKIKAKYLIIDTETSGVRAWEHAIIQLAAVALDDQLDVVETFNMYVIPPEESQWDTEAEAIHGLSQAFLQERGVSYEEVGHAFVAFVKEYFDEKPILVGQFLPFDYSFLDKVFETAFPGSGLFQNILSRNFIDTKSMANVMNLKADLLGKPSIFLETSLSKAGGLIYSLGLDPQDYKAHDALDDCLATRDVLIKLIDLMDIHQLPDMSS